MPSPGNMDSTAANTAPLPKPKDEPSYTLGPLTPQEIESLRQDRQRVSALNREFFRKDPETQKLKAELRAILNQPAK